MSHETPRIKKKNKKKIGSNTNKNEITFLWGDRDFECQIITILRIDMCLIYAWVIPETLWYIC